MRILQVLGAEITALTVAVKRLVGLNLELQWG
jgi:hypothetical protein